MHNMKHSQVCVCCLPRLCTPLLAGKTVQCVAFCAAVLGKTGTADDAALPQLQPLNEIVPPEKR